MRTICFFCAVYSMQIHAALDRQTVKCCEDVTIWFKRKIPNISQLEDVVTHRVAAFLSLFREVWWLEELECVSANALEKTMDL